MTAQPMTLFGEEMEERIKRGKEQIAIICGRYRAHVVEPDDFGLKKGPFHAASILSWSRIAAMTRILHIPSREMACFPIEDAWAMIDHQEVSKESLENFKKVEAYANKGGYWRTDLCASEEVKHHLSQGNPLPKVIPFHFDDPRIMELHTYMPYIKVIARPRVTPYLVNGYPAEFRVFLGGDADELGAVSFYYPQAGDFEVTPILEAGMKQAFINAQMVNMFREELSLIPWIPQNGEPDDRIGCSIDFIMNVNGQVIMVDAGPGYGHGAHPCCFLDVPVSGMRWHPEPGVTIR